MAAGYRRRAVASASGPQAEPTRRACRVAVNRGRLPRMGDPMLVPFNVRDFLDRAESPTRSGRRLSTSPTSRPIHGRRSPSPGWLVGPAAGGRTRPAWGGTRRACRDRVAQLVPPAHLLLRGLRLGAHPRARELPAGRRRGGVHRRTRRGLHAPRRPRARPNPWPASRHRTVRPRRRERRAALPGGSDPRALDRRRSRHRHHQLHVGHDRPAQGGPAHPSQLLGQRRSLRLAPRPVRP